MKLQLYDSCVLSRKRTKIIVLHLDKIVITIRARIIRFILFLIEITFIETNISLQLFIISRSYS